MNDDDIRRLDKLTDSEGNVREQERQHKVRNSTCTSGLRKLQRDTLIALADWNTKKDVYQFEVGVAACTHGTEQKEDGGAWTVVECGETEDYGIWTRTRDDTINAALARFQNADARIQGLKTADNSYLDTQDDDIDTLVCMLP